MNCPGKSQANQNHFYCDVCKINIPTEAEYALHEFSKKHCDNLLRIAKNKPIVSKNRAAKSEMPTINKEQPKVNAITTQGNIAKYGYFVPGEVYEKNTESKEFNTEYDPYLQKYAENPLKELPQQPAVQPVELPVLPTSNITGFKRKKKKKTKTCQICNVTLLTVPDYEAHMRSPQHSWKLKMTGMGVSAHFVKASSDLHTVETNEDSAASEENEEYTSQTDNADKSASPVIFPTLYCDICELLLNSEQQFNTHVNGKSHNDNVQKKAEIKAKKQQLENVSLNQLYCFSCKVALNNLQQYNEHKFGKKHKMKCRRLMREGITIPPEERVASWGVPKLDPNKPVIYPEMYEKFLLETQKKGNLSDGTEIKLDNNSAGNYCCIVCSASFSDVSAYQLHLNSEEHQKLICSEARKPETTVFTPRLIFHNKNNSSRGEETENSGQEKNEVNIIEQSHDNKQINELNIIGVSETIKCSVCGLDFMEESTFGLHLSAEDHFSKILELKEKGTSDDKIVEMLFKDRSLVKPDKLGRYSCNICSVTTGSVTEYRQHVSSVVHKQTEEEYQRKRKLEVKSTVSRDETGTFMCKLCREGFTTLTVYNEHLHTAKHKDGLKTEKARELKVKNRLLLQQRRVKQKYIISGLKRKDFTWWRKNCEKNPGVKTKVVGTPADSSTESKSSLANPEEQESKVVSTDKDTGIKRVTEEEGPKSDKRMRHDNWNRGTTEPYKTVKPLMAVNNTVPFLPRPPPLMSTTAWRPCFTPQFRPNFMCGLPNNLRGRYPVNRYQRGPSFRPSRHRYPPCYN